ncbi:DUF4810 domain-containing protein [Pseudomonas sp. MBLB4123]|uniref:DUF4810 domain-containing protein n=1 Tax=Pseudomonas sp. MBLB4123 TaxID=3451557 RepID=UPI003F74B4E9
MPQQKQPYAALLTLAAATLLGGCVSQPKPLYHWVGYQEQVYAHFKNDGSGPEQQIAALEASLQEARAQDAVPPPGFHAHLGMLYAEVGKADQVRQQFETEKTLFPESAPYMDFLLRNAER